jgi:hypothetical protein
MGLWLGRRTGRTAAGELRRHLIEIGKETTGKTAHLLGFVHLDVVQRIEVAAEISYQPQLFRPLRECGIEGVLSRHNAKRRGEVLLIERLDGIGASGRTDDRLQGPAEHDRGGPRRVGAPPAKIASGL